MTFGVRALELARSAAVKYKEVRKIPCRFIKIRLVRIFSTLAEETRKKRAIFTTEETKTMMTLRTGRKKKKNPKFTGVI